MIAFISGIVLFASCVFAQTQQRTVTSYRYQTSTPPSGTRCNVRGSLAAANVLRDFYVVGGNSGRDSCRDACFDYGAQCNSYAIHTDNWRCRLFKTTLIEQGYRTSPVTPNVDFYAKACWVDSYSTVLKTTLTSDTVAYDDEYFALNLPFPLTLYGTSAYLVYMSVNGIISFTAPQSSYSNTFMPNHDGTGSQYLPPTSVCAFWDDLVIQNKTSATQCSRRQSLSWTIAGVNPTRTITFNWRATYGKVAPYTGVGLVDVDMIIFEDKPGRLNLRYNDISDDKGSGATVGIQGPGNGQGAVASTNNPNMKVGTVFEYQPNTDFWYETA